MPLAAWTPSYEARRLALLAFAALPVLWLAYAANADALGANPVEKITHVTGDWALRWLLASLAVTPLRQWLGWRWVAAHRRTLGLLCFFYAALHLATYAVLDQGLALEFVWDDIVERPFITAGMTAFACLVPLAVTSTRGWVRRLGRRWVALHRLAYVAASAAVVHYVWLVKADLAKPSAYAAVLGALLTARVLYRARGRANRPVRA